MRGYDPCTGELGRMRRERGREREREGGKEEEEEMEGGAGDKRGVIIEGERGGKKRWGRREERGERRSKGEKKLQSNARKGRKGIYLPYFSWSGLVRETEKSFATTSHPLRHSDSNFPSAISGSPAAKIACSATTASDAALFFFPRNSGSNVLMPVLRRRLVNITEEESGFTETPC